MSILTIILLIVFVILLQFAPIYLVWVGVHTTDEEEVIQGFYFTRAPLILAVLMVIHYGRENIKIVSGRTFYEAYEFLDELETTSKD